MALPGLLEVFLAVACFVFVLVAFSRSSNGLPKNLPFVGMWPYLLPHISDFHDWATDILLRTNLTFFFKGSWFTGSDIIVTVHPEDVNYILTTNFDNFAKGEEFGELFDMFGKAIFVLDFEPWKAKRKILQQVFAHHQFKKFNGRSMLAKLEAGFIPVLDLVVKRGEPADFQEIVQRLMFDVNFLAVNGHDPCSLSVDFPPIPSLKAMDEAEEAMFYRYALPKVVWKFMRWLNVGTERKYKEAWEALDAAMADVIAMKRREVEEGKKNDDDDGTGASILEFHLREYEFEDSVLRDTMLSNLLAGKNTVASAFLWLIWLLSTHKEAELKIREELNAILSPDEKHRRRLFTADEVKGMTYLHGALCETMRLYPPVPFETKVPVKPDTLPSGHRVFPKHRIIIFMYSMGRMPAIWGDDCKEFKPERWISEKGVAKHVPPNKFIAFLAGPRSCLGKEMAFTQLKMMAAALLHNYNVHVLEGQGISFVNSLILMTKNGIKVKITDRWS